MPQADAEQTTEEDAGTSKQAEQNDGAPAAVEPTERALAFLAGEQPAEEAEEPEQGQPGRPDLAGSKDPVDAALNFLAPEAEESEPAATAEKTDKTKDKQGDAPAGDAAADKAKTAAADVVEKALKGTDGKPADPKADKPKGDAPAEAASEEPADLDDATKARMPAKATKAFAELRQRARKLQDELKARDAVMGEDRQWADHGRAFAGAFQQRKALEDLAAINDDEHVGVVRIQAAINRATAARAAGQQPAKADIDMVTAAAAQLEQFAPRPAAPQLTPFAGDLPAEQRELVDAGLLSEADARLLLGARALAAAKPKADPAQAAAPAPAAKAPPAPVPAAPAAPRQPATGQPAPDADRVAWARKTSDLIIASGVPAAQVGDHFVSTIQPQLIALLKDTAAKTGESAWSLYLRLPPQAQHNLAALAIEKAGEAQRAAQPAASGKAPGRPQRVVQPLTQRELSQGQRPRVPSLSTSRDPVGDALDFLSGPTRSRS